MIYKIKVCGEDVRNVQLYLNPRLSTCWTGFI